MNTSFAGMVHGMIHRDAGSVLLVSGTTEQNLDINFAFGKFLGKRTTNAISK